MTRRKSDPDYRPPRYGPCRGCGRVALEGTACISTACRLFVPINRRTDADYRVHDATPTS